MSDTEPNDTKTRHRRREDRVTLDLASMARIDGWITVVTASAKGVMISRKDVVNWLVQHQDVALSAEQLRDLRSKFFSDVRFLQQAIRELKAARLRGESIELSAILAGGVGEEAVGHEPRRTGRRSKRRDDKRSPAMVSTPDIDSTEPREESGPDMS